MDACGNPFKVRNKNGTRALSGRFATAIGKHCLYKFSVEPETHELSDGRRDQIEKKIIFFEICQQTAKNEMCLRTNLS